MNQVATKQFREQIRILERKFGLLNKQTDQFCCDAITLSQCHALVEIGRANKLSLKDLSIILTLDISTTSRTVDSLVKKGYVKRMESKTDRRSIEITLSDSGIVLFTSIEQEMNDKYCKIFSKIPSSEQKMVLDSLEILISAFTSTTQEQESLTSL